MLRVTLPIIFVSLLGRIPTHAVPYFILILALISVIVAIRGIRHGYLYHNDIFNVTMFLSAFTTYMVSPERVLPWMIHKFGPVMYITLAVVTMAPSLLLQRSEVCFAWRSEPLYIPMVILVLWGTTFILSSTMLWLGAPARTPLLIIAIMTMPTRIALARELKFTRHTSGTHRKIQEWRTK